jgi:hypothetical protein
LTEAYLKPYTQLLKAEKNNRSIQKVKVANALVKVAAKDKDDSNKENDIVTFEQ